MLLAVNIGRSKPSRLNLLSRRSIRRLRLFNCRRILTFTRNPLLAEVDERLLTNQTPQKAWGFRDFQFFSRKTLGSTLVQGLELEPGAALVRSPPWAPGAAFRL